MLFAHCLTQRVIELDAGKFQRGGFDIRALKGLDTEETGLVRIDQAVVVHVDGGGGNFQQGVGGCVETTGFHVHHNRQEAPETVRQRRFGLARGHGIAFFIVKVELAHGISLTVDDYQARRQWMCSPARSGTTAWSPKGSSAGTAQLSRTRVMVSVLRGRP